MAFDSRSNVGSSDDLIFPRQQGGEKGGKRQKSSISTRRSDKSCSIPSKYSTTLFDKSKLSGFGSSDMRFTSMDFFEDPCPGPGTYESMSNSTLSEINPSFSKKGYGNGFVSDKDRGVAMGANFVNRGPGPGAYTTGYHTSAEGFYFKQKSNQYRIQNQTVANWNSHTKNLGLATTNTRTNFERKRGPGTYNPKMEINEKNPGNMLQSKDYPNMNPKNPVPPPGRYHLNRNMIKKKPYKNPGPYSSFAGTVLQHKIN